MKRTFASFGGFVSEKLRTDVEERITLFNFGKSMKLKKLSKCELKVDEVKLKQHNFYNEQETFHHNGVSFIADGRVHLV